MHIRRSRGRYFIHRQLVDTVYGLIANVMLGQTQGMKEGVPS